MSLSFLQSFQCEVCINLVRSWAEFDVFFLFGSESFHLVLQFPFVFLPKRNLFLAVLHCYFYSVFVSVVLREGRAFSGVLIVSSSQATTVNLSFGGVIFTCVHASPPGIMLSLPSQVFLFFCFPFLAAVGFYFRLQDMGFVVRFPED